MMRGMDLAAIAAELYALPPGAFTAARNERAKQLKTEGERSLAQQVARLAKPTVSAWAADALALRGTGLLERVVDLGARLRQAQESLDPDRLRTLAKERALMLPEVVAAARALAQESGVAVSDAAAAEIDQTLRAAMADERASAAVQSGLLVRALEGNGLEPVDLSGAVAVPGALDGASAAAAGPTQHGDTGGRETTVRTGSGERPRDGADRRRTQDAKRKAEEERRRADQLRREERAEAEADRDEAAQALDEAQAELAGTERDAADAAARARGLADELAGLRARIAELEDDLAAAQREAAAADRARGLAARLVERELRAVAKAEERLSGLG
jgi:hypothetical protein